MKLREYPFEKYGHSEIRVIDDTDFACEGDDPFATIHLLLTKKFDVRAITAANFLHIPGSVQKSYDKIYEMLDAMDARDQVKVCMGSMPMTSETEYETSEASDFIVEEAMREDDRPLFVVVQGAITNIAVALKTRPEIESRMHIIWIGGQPYPQGGWEFNLSNDVIAARVVMNSNVSLWQVPADVYSMMRCSFMDLYENIYDCGKPGKWLCDQLFDFNLKAQKMFHGEGNAFGDDTNTGLDAIPHNTPESMASFGCGEQWQLGDCPVVGLMLNAELGSRTIEGAPYINDDSTYTLRPENPHKIAVYHSIDSQFILRDLFAKLRYQYGPRK